MLKPNLAIAPEGPVTFPKLGSPKLDGIRCLTHANMTLSRSLKPIPNNHVRATLTPYQGLDGELIVGEPSDPDVYLRTNSAVMTIKGEPDFTYYIFDQLYSTAAFQARLEAIRAMTLPPFIRVLPQVLIESQEQLDTFYGNLIELGYEGAILRNLTALYKFGRSTAKSQDMLKLKPFEDSEALVLDVYEAMYNGNEAFINELGHTDRSTAMAGLEGKGMLGGFIVRDIYTGVEFDCAPGKSTHQQRIEWWQSKPLGRILKYRFMPHGVKDKPRHPRFIGWRESIDMGE